MTRALLFFACIAAGAVLVALGRYILAQLDVIRELQRKREILESCAARRNRRTSATELAVIANYAAEAAGEVERYRSIMRGGPEAGRQPLKLKDAGSTPAPATNLEDREEGRPETNRSPRPALSVRGDHDQQGESLAAGNVAESQPGPLLESHPGTLSSISVRLTRALIGDPERKE